MTTDHLYTVSHKNGTLFITAITLSITYTLLEVAIKICLLKALVWPVVMYGCKSWTLKGTEENRINAFEMKSLRQVLWIPRTTRKTNDWVCETAGVEQSLLKSVKRRKLTYFGHVMHKVRWMSGEGHYTRHHSWNRKAWQTKDILISNITSWTRCRMGQLVHIANDREAWRTLVHSATNPRSEKGWRQVKTRLEVCNWRIHS